MGARSACRHLSGGKQIYRGLEACCLYCWLFRKLFKKGICIAFFAEKSGCFVDDHLMPAVWATKIKGTSTKKPGASVKVTGNMKFYVVVKSAPSGV